MKNPPKFPTLQAMACAASLTFALNANAATVVYTNEGDFLSALSPGFYLEDFSAYPTPGSIGPILSLSGGDGFAYTLSAPLNLYSGNGIMSVNSDDDSLTATFTGNPVTAVGGNFYNSDFNINYIAGSVTIGLNDGTTRTYSPVDVASSFTGFTSDVPITSITIASANWPVMDDFYVGQAAIPEPSGLALFGIGAGMLSMLRRRG